MCKTCTKTCADWMVVVSKGPWTTWVNAVWFNHLALVPCLCFLSMQQTGLLFHFFFGLVPLCVFLVVVVVWDLKLILTILKVYSSILRCATSTMPVLQVTAVNPPSAHPTEGPSLFVSRWRLAWRFVFNVMNVYGNSGMPDKCTHLGMTHVPKLERPHTNNNPSRLFLLLSQYSQLPTTRRGRENS